MARRNRKGGNTAGLKGWSGFVSKPSSAPASHLRAVDDRASMRAARERQHLEKTGKEYQESEEGTKLEHTPISEVAASDAKKKQNILNRLLGRDKEKMEVGSLEEQQKREEIALHGTKKGPEGGGRTKTHYDEKGEPIVFKSEEHKKQYEDNLAKIKERRFNVYGDSATITESGEVVKTPRTKDMAISTHYKAGAGTKTGVKGEPSEGDIKKGGYHGSKGWVSAEEAEKKRTAHDVALEKENIRRLEEENLRNLRDIDKLGVTSEMDLTFEGEQTKLKDPSKYADRPRQIVTDYDTGTITEKVKRKGLRGALGGYKPTGRVIEDKAYQEELAEKKALADEKKKNKKKKGGKSKLSKEQKKANKEKKQLAINKARETGADHYYLGGVRYTLPGGQTKF